MPKLVNVAISLGSNVGNRYQYLLNAEKRLLTLPKTSNFRFSSIYYSIPLTIEEGAPYLDAAITFDTSLQAEEILTFIREIEKEHGRVHPAPRNASRKLGLDILLYGSQIIPTISPAIPHPRMHERLFVLTPLAEISPPWMLHPTLKKTIIALEQELKGKIPQNNWLNIEKENFVCNFNSIKSKGLRPNNRRNGI